MNKYKLMIIALLSVPSFCLASAQNSAGLRPVHMIAQKQEAYTKTDASDMDARPRIVDPASGGKIVCKEGYVLTEVTSTAESRDNVSVFGECNGFSVAGYTHTWCKNAPTVYHPVKEGPTTAYSCKKIVSKWVAVAA